MEIKLTRGKIAIIDDEDFDLIKGYRWVSLFCGAGWYAVHNYKDDDGKKKSMLMRRLLLSAPVEMVVDHADSDGLNNRRSNLRLCTQTENMRNRKLHKSSVSGIKGVRFEIKYNRYAARVQCDGRIYKNSFKKLEDAKSWVSKKRTELHGEFSYRPEIDSRM